MIGRTIGNYIVRDKIGEGGMGVVYLAEHPRIGKRVAIKVLLPQLSHNAEVVSRFFTEARASSAIHNEHIIDIIDFGELPDRSSYIIMEWLDGESLSAVLEREHALPLARVQHIARGIGRALAAAHSHGIVHRDLKPDNIFLITHGEDRDFVKVLDFGIAKLLGEDGAQAEASKTRTGAIIGTPMYMSPEQCRGVSVDARSDTYAFGVIVYQMLAGQVPFFAEGLGELLLKHMTEAARPLRELVPTLPESVERAVLHALEKDPHSRYARVEQFVSDLGVVVTGVVPAVSITVGPTAVHVSATDSLGGATRIGTGAPRGLSRAWLILPLVLGGAVAAAKLWPARPSEPTGIVGDVRTVAPVPTPIVPHPTAIAAPARFEVRATPKEAKIVVDGIVRSNPWQEERPADGSTHSVSLSAEGFVPYSTEVKLDGNVTVAKSLDFLAPGGRGRAPGRDLAPVTTQKPKAHAVAPVKTTAPITVKKADDAPTTYKGTKGTLITDDPFAVH